MRPNPVLIPVLVLLLAAAALAGLVHGSRVQSRNAEQQSQLERQRAQAHRLAERMRQSSNELTMMVRLYGSTGEAHYRDYFRRILAIRAGTAPRPEDYDGSFWDRVLAQGDGAVRYGPPKSLLALVGEAGLADDEIAELHAALEASDRLAQMETGYMDALAELDVPPGTPAHAARAFPLYQRLASPSYFQTKGAIMAGVERFIGRVDERTQRQAAGLRAQWGRQAMVQTALAAALLSIGVLAAALLYGAARLRRGVREREALETELREAKAQTEAALARAQNQFRDIVDNAPMAIWAKDGDGRYLFANKTYRQMFGVGAHRRVLGERDEAFFSAEAAQGFRRNDAQVMGAGTAQEFVETIDPQSEHPRNVLSVKFPMRDENGTVYAAGGICMDITGQMRMQKELQRTSGMLSAILDHAPAAIWAKDRSGTFLFANAAFHAVAHIPADRSVVGRNNRDVFPHAIAEAFRVSDLRVQESGQAERLVEQTGTPDAAGHSLSVKFPLVDERGRVYATGGIAFDISEQVRLQDELRELNATLEHRVTERAAEADAAGRRVAEIADSLPGAVYELIRDRNGRYAVPFVSRGVVELLGVEPAKIQADLGAFVGAIHPDDRARFTSLLQGETEDLTRFSYSIRVVHQGSGEMRWVLVTSMRKTHEDGTRLSRGFFTDITHIKQLESELAAAREVAEAAARTKSHFLANMSHEIRTPLNAIIGMSHLALQTELDARQLNYLSKIDSAARSLLGIVNDVLDVSKIEAGKLVMETLEFNLQDVLDHLTMLLGQKVQDKGLELLFRVDPAIPNELLGDPLRLGQILTNYVGNATKFTERGEIVVSVELVERSDDAAVLRFAVHDTGIGMTPEQLDRMFQAFEQADTSITRKFGGTGLGLTIAKHLAEMMGGRVGADSVAGQGSTFWFTARLGVQKNARVPVRIAAQDLAGRRVLLVDDNASAREILASLLGALGLAPTACASGEEALAELGRSAPEHPYALVVLDWKMPGLSGAETARRIRSLPALAQQPAILMVTAYGREDLARDLGGVQIEGLLVKPVSASALLDATLLAFGREALPARAVMAPAAPTHAALRGRRVLLVEDNEINQEIAAEVLRQAGIAVTLANNGHEAVERVGSGSFDLVLMDMQMPVMDGIEATRAIRAEARHRTLPILAMTANVMAEDIKRCFDAGMNDHVGKPIDVEELMVKLERWMRPLGEREERRETRTVMLGTRAEHLPKTMDGIDLAVALKNMVSNRALVRKLLLKFRESHADAINRVRDALAARQHDTATRHAHTLKAVAGNIGARDLQSAAGRLETALRENGDVAAGIESAAAELARVVAAIASIDERQESPRDRRGQVAASVTDPVRVRRLLDALAEKLDDDDMAAVEVAERLGALGLEGSALPLLRNLESAVAAYDFDSAREHLERLVHALNLPPE